MIQTREEWEQGVRHEAITESDRQLAQRRWELQRALMRLDAEQERNDCLRAGVLAHDANLPPRPHLTSGSVPVVPVNEARHE